MAKEKTAYRCRECGAVAPRWEGRCHACGDWNTLVEEARRPRALAEPVSRPVPVGEVPVVDGSCRASGLAEVDRVLGGGLVAGSVTLLGGEPGVGKSTLLLQLLANIAATGSPTLLVTAEESAQQVRMRAERLGAVDPQLWLAAETALPSIEEA